MPIYPFENQAGETLDIVCSMNEVEKYPVGEWVDLEGLKLRRQFSKPQTKAPSTQAEMEVHCLQMPRWMPEAPRWDSRGRAVLLSKKEKEEFAAKTGAVDGQGVDKDSWND